MSGTVNRLVKFSGATTGGNSLLFDNGTSVGLGTATPTSLLHVLGAGTITSLHQNSSAANDALWGQSTAAAGAGNGTGVVGVTAQASAGASGVWGQNSNANGTGVIGLGNNQGSTVLTAGSGGAFVGSGTGLFARSTASASGQAIYTEQFSSPVRVGFFNGTTFFKINGAGSVSTNVVDVTDPDRKRRITLYAPEAPEILFQDFGSGQLVNGRARIDLDPRLAGAIIVDEKHPLRVFIQLEDDENIVGVVVKNKSVRGFEVVERMGGKSNAPFQWQIVANRADEVLPGGRVSRNADVRFQEHRAPEAVEEAPPRGGERDGGEPSASVSPSSSSDASRGMHRTAAGAGSVTPDVVAAEPAAASDGGCSTSRGRGASLLLIVLALGFAARRRWR